MVLQLEATNPTTNALLLNNHFSVVHSVDYLARFTSLDSVILRLISNDNCNIVWIVDECR